MYESVAQDNCDFTLCFHISDTCASLYMEIEGLYHIRARACLPNRKLTDFYET